MSSRESFIVPPDCALRRDFPEGVVHAQMVGSESYDGPSYVDLYAESWEAVPRTPRLHLQIDSGASASSVVEAALREAHRDDKCLSDGDYGCIALDSLSITVRHHQKGEVNANV